jgi:hypothetical protein
MKYIFVALLLVSAPAYSFVWVESYVAPDGTIVPGHYRTDSNDILSDNFSNRENFSPFTGPPGSKPRDEDVSDYQQRQEQRAERIRGEEHNRKAREYNEALETQRAEMEDH